MGISASRLAESSSAAATVSRNATSDQLVVRNAVDVRAEVVIL
jgi:hypothetical protein